MINLKTQINEEKFIYVIIISRVANENEKKKWNLNWKLKILEAYRDLARTFNDQKTNFLSSHHEENLTFQITFDQTSSFEFLYKLSHNELKALWKYLQLHLKINFIRLFKSSARASIVFAWKKNDKLRLCVNYRDLNYKSMKDHYLLFLIENLLQQLAKTEIFT